ncbi:MAG: LPS export ABC transporter ATP-binding protein [Spirochaetae bacterium HGW-Spirochaetae-9]|nr:MAG: LPS export ABC transporter ATP-binding protein [Spirochaetae bacterium HGW-Spirochaetae-9]
MSGSLLEVKGLRKLYGRKVAVADVGFTMRTGEVVGLLGPNGAGKTTVFYMLAGFLRPSAGSIELDGAPLNGLSMYKRARLGISYLPQEASIFRKLTVEDNILAVLEARADLDAKARRARAKELLEEFNIERIAKQPGYTLSGGERRRTEIARALAIEPKFLLLDEPFTGIDPIAIHEIKKIVRRLSAAGIGVLLTDHNVRDTLDITDRSYIIHLGQIIVSGDREAILGDEGARSLYLGEEFRM